MPAPSESEIVTILTNVARREGLIQPPAPLLERIAVKSERNLRRALLMLETARVIQYVAFYRSTSAYT